MAVDQPTHAAATPAGDQSRIHDIGYRGYDGPPPRPRLRPPLAVLRSPCAAPTASAAR